MGVVVALQSLPPARAAALAHDNMTLPVADRIIRLRERTRLSRAEVARRMRVAPRLVARLEAGGSAVTRERVKRVAAAMRLREELFYPGARPDLFWNRVEAELSRWRPNQRAI